MDEANKKTPREHFDGNKNGDANGRGSNRSRRPAKKTNPQAAAQMNQKDPSADSLGLSFTKGRRSQSNRQLSSLPESSGKVPRQKFIKNNQYFTICVYAGVMLIIAAIIFKCIIDIDKTKASIAQFFQILSPFLLGALMAYVLNPLVHLIYVGIEKLAHKIHMPLHHIVHIIIAITITYLIVIGVVVMIIVFVIPEIVTSISDFVRYLPQAYDTVMQWLERLQERFPNIDVQRVTKPLVDMLPDTMAYLQNIATDVAPAVYQASVSVASWLVNLLLTLIVSIYMLYDKKRIMHTSWELIYAFVPRKYIPALQEILSECNHIFSNFVVGKFIDSCIIGALCFILMSILQLDYVLLISIIVGITNMIPYFGPFIGAIPGALIMLFIKPIHALIFLIMILVLQQFDGLILGPKILGNSTGMKPLGIIFAITVGGSLFGVLGMFLGVPVVAILTYLFDLYLNHRLKKNQVSETMVETALDKMELDD